MKLLFVFLYGILLVSLAADMALRPLTSLPLN